MQYDIMKYGTHALIGFGGALAYDVFIEGRELNGGFAFSDASTFALSTVVSNLTYDVLSGLLPYLNDGSFAGMIAQPILNGLVYMYLYDYMTGSKYPSIRNETQSFIMGSIGVLILSYVENPILSLFNLRSL